MIAAMIVDDEPLARETLRGMCERSGRIKVVAEAEDGQAAIDQLALVSPALLFVDISMPRVDGIALASHVRALAARPAIVLATAFDHYAACAFDLDVIDYLLKPLDTDRFDRALSRVEKRLNGATTEADRRHERELWLPSRGTMTRVELTGICHVSAEGDYVRIYTLNRSFLLRETLGTIEARLGPKFVRLHRSTLIRKSIVLEVRALGGGVWTAIDEAGNSHRIGRKYLSAFRAACGVNSPSSQCA